MEQQLDYDWWEPVYDDFLRITALLGVETTETDVQFSGFYSQGDGASYTGSYHYAQMAHARIREYAPEDAELHRIADALLELQRRCGFQLSARITRSGSHYVHAMTMQVDLDGDNPPDVETALTELLRDLAGWLYRALENEYDYLCSNSSEEQ